VGANYILKLPEKSDLATTTGWRDELASTESGRIDKSRNEKSIPHPPQNVAPHLQKHLYEWAGI
jgi:hypothetical protein